MTNEQHAQDFLYYVANNEKELKKALKKNITYNEDIFDDVFQDTILKVYDRIMKGERINDFKSYFFIASKFHYINIDNKVKTRNKQDDREFLQRVSQGYEFDSNTCDAIRFREKITDDSDEWKIKEEKNEKINMLMKYLAKELNDNFSAAETDIFLIYYRLKAEKTGVSYRKMSIITGRPLSEITQIIKKIKRYIKDNEDIQENKKKILKT